MVQIRQIIVLTGYFVNIKIDFGSLKPAKQHRHQA